MVKAELCRIKTIPNGMRGGDLGMEFVDDTTVKMSLMGMSIEGTYTVEGNTVTIEYFDQPIAFQRNGNQLSAEYDGEAMVLEKE